MHRDGADPLDMQPADFLCDFCERAWDGASPMIEGHQGSLICDRCLSVACRAVLLDQGDVAAPGLTCTLCLEERDQRGWRSPVRDQAVVCERCVRQASQALSKEPGSEWSRPE